MLLSELEAPWCYLSLRDQVQWKLERCLCSVFSTLSIVPWVNNFGSQFKAFRSNKAAGEKQADAEVNRQLRLVLSQKV